MTRTGDNPDGGARIASDVTALSVEVCTWVGIVMAFFWFH
jgi:hypothetical protein